MIGRGKLILFRIILESILSDIPEFYKLQWCFSAPSYINGIQKNKTSPGFVVADILLGKQLGEEDIEFILKKLLF
jgi:hypothetical protein